MHTLHMHTHMHICMYICVHICMHICTHVCTYSCTYAHMYVHMHAHMHTCMHTCMHICMHMATFMATRRLERSTSTPTCMDASAHADACARVHAPAWMHVHVYTAGAPAVRNARSLTHVYRQACMGACMHTPCGMHARSPRRTLHDRPSRKRRLDSTRLDPTRPHSSHTLLRGRWYG